MEKNKKLQIILSVLVILASAIVAIVFVSNPNYTNLVTASVTEIGQMSKTLTDAGIEHKISEGNTSSINIYYSKLTEEVITNTKKIIQNKNINILKKDDH